MMTFLTTFYITSANANYSGRLENYLRNELLVGLTPECQLHTGLWLSAVAKGEFWALKSMF